jgi:poly(3-hydroxybutyrate) depolymerase
MLSLHRNRVATLAAALVLGLAGVAHAQAPVEYGNRTMYVHVPSRLPPAGSRALVVVLHGGLGNAERIVSRQSEKGLNMDLVADRYHFVVAYLNGTAVTELLGADKKGWNAGECCGKSAADKVDDVAYISGAVRLLAQRYGIDPGRVYGVGHSNGAMMTLRLLCETDLYAAAVPVSGTLELAAGSCPRARGKNILAIRGANDENVPMAGGKGKGLSRTDYRSQEYTRQAFAGSGARYTLQVLPGAGHSFDAIERAIEQAEGIGFAEKAARFFGLDR